MSREVRFVHERMMINGTYLVLKNAIKRLNDLGRMPPLGLLDHVCNSCGSSTSFRLNLAHRSETTRRECLLEFAGYTVIGVIMRLERRENPLTVFVSLLLGRHAPVRGSRAI